MTEGEMDRLKTRLAEVRATVEGPPCPFCEIVADRAPATILEDWNGAMAIKPRNPVTAGHTLIIPKVHVIDFAASVPISAMTMDYAARFVTEWYPDTDVNVITSRGAAATQTVFHLHVHVVPRTDGDGLHLPWTGQVKA